MTEAWSYSQRSGLLRDPAGLIVERGYSGSEPATNRPIAEGVENVGPIPTGTYAIAVAVDHETCGPCSLPLLPAVTNEMHGRSDFLIHGDTDPPGSASTGCIIMSRATRDLINASTCKTLTVTT